MPDPDQHDKDDLNWTRAPMSNDSNGNGHEGTPLDKNLDGHSAPRNREDKYKQQSVNKVR